MDVKQDKKHKNDLRLIAFAAGLCLIMFLIRWIYAENASPGSQGGETEPWVTVSVDNEPVLICSLSALRDAEDGEELRASSSLYDEDMLIFSEEGVEVWTELGYNMISYAELSDGTPGVRCLRADCPDKVCVDQGIIALSTDVIVCLPHRLTVRIEPRETML